MAKYRIPSDYKNDVPRANHNFDAEIYGTIHPGFVIPIHHRHLGVGDRVRGMPSVLIQSQAMLGPLLQGFKYVTIATFTPDSVFYGWMRNGIPDDPQEYLAHTKYTFSPISAKNVPESSVPSLEMPGFSIMPTPSLQVGVTSYESWLNDTDFGPSTPFDHIGRGSLWDWLGVPAGAVLPKLTTVNTAAFRWNVAPAFSYFLSCYYYFRNPQEKYMYYSMDAKTVSDSGAIPFNSLFKPFDPSVLLHAISALSFSKTPSGSTPEAGPDIFDSTNFLSDPERGQLKNWLSFGMGSHGGFFPAPYSPDLFGNIIQNGTSPTAYIEVENVSGGDRVAVTEVRQKSKWQAMLDRLFASGGMLSDIFRTLFGKNSRIETNKPDFIGAWQAQISPSNVVASASGSADGEDVSAGQMVARMDRFSDFKGSSGVDYTAKEPGTLMFLAVLVPDPAYCQGLHPDLYGDSFADDFNPELNGLGFQSVPRHRFSMMPQSFSEDGPWLASGTATGLDPNQVSVGEEVAWSWLKTDYSRLHGEFAQNGFFQYWTLARRFTDFYLAGPDQVRSVVDYYGTYVNPLAWQYLFAGTSLSSPNFVLMANLNLTVTNEVSKNYMPYLGR